jgi:GNAT superfamily N-acetyltransferase
VTCAHTDFTVPEIECPELFLCPYYVLLDFLIKRGKDICMGEHVYRKKQGLMYTLKMKRIEGTDKKILIDINLKDAGELTDLEKEEHMALSIRMYPEFAELYKKNRYYSSIRPQKVWNIRHEGMLIGTGKFLWKDIDVNNVKRKMCGFGVLVLDDYQRKGIGKQIIAENIEETKRVGGDFLYASTSNEIVDRILEKAGFMPLTTPVVYNKPGEAEKHTDSKSRSYIYEITPGMYAEIEDLEEFDIGDGPV